MEKVRELSFELSDTSTDEVIRVPIEIPTKPVSEIEYEYSVEQECLKEKIKFLERSVETLIQENIQLKLKYDEVEAIKLQIRLSDRIREDMKVCRALEIENQKLRDLIMDIYKTEELRPLVKFRNKELDEKYGTKPWFGFQFDEIDLYGTYKQLVNYNDVMRSDNIYLKVELGRLREVYDSRAQLKSEHKMMKHELNNLRELITNSLNLECDNNRQKGGQASQSGSLLSKSTSLSKIATIFSNKSAIQNPFKSLKSNTEESLSAMRAEEKPTLKSVRERLEAILQEEKQISSHLQEKVIKCTAKREARYNPPDIYCKYFLKSNTQPEIQVDKDQ